MLPLELYPIAGAPHPPRRINRNGAKDKNTKVRNTPSTAGNSMASSERPSPEPILKKEASPAVLGGREFWKRSESLKCLESEGLGHPSRTLEGNSRKRSEGVPGAFPEFFRKVPAVLGVWPKRWQPLGWRFTLSDLKIQGGPVLRFGSLTVHAQDGPSDSCFRFLRSKLFCAFIESF